MFRTVCIDYLSTAGDGCLLKAPPDCSGTLDSQFFGTHNTSAKSSAFINLREICDHHKLPPGEYVIIPSTFQPNEEGDYILRVYSERKNDQVQYVVVLIASLINRWLIRH